MTAVTRWVQYDVSETGVAGTGGGTLRGRGTRGYSLATEPVDDSFNIGITNNRLYLKADGAPATEYGITLASGAGLDPRFVAKDITEKMHLPGTNTGWDQAECVWESNGFKIYSGTLGINSSITVWSGTNTAHLELGFGTRTEQGGVAENSTGSLNGDAENYVSVSGTYNGFFDETYRIVINKEASINTPVQGGGNTYTGTISTGGIYNKNAAVTYTLIISSLNGTTMGAGTGNVPTVSWTSVPTVDDGGPVELLYADYWYKIGIRGLMVKFTDAIFPVAANPAWTIVCNAVTHAEGSNVTAVKGVAKYRWGSNRGDDLGSDASLTTNNGVTTNPVWTRLGSRGLYVQFNTEDSWAGANLSAGDEFVVICTPPQPTSYNVTNLNYGNVTVSTESPVRNVIFEILSADGAVLISTVKFGLQNHGNFEHHGESNNDTLFRFGTVGPGNNAGVNPQDGQEWWPNVTATPDMADLSDIPPTWLYAINHNLSVVADADSSEALGVSTFAGMVADPTWLNIKLGASEVGANSTINYRIYFDYA